MTSNAPERIWVDLYFETFEDAPEKMAALTDALARLTAERDAAVERIAEMERAIVAKGGGLHAPTEDAYLAACRAVEGHRARADAAVGRAERAAPDFGTPEFDALVEAATAWAETMAEQYDEMMPSGGLTEAIVWGAIRTLRGEPDGGGSDDH